MKVHFVTPTRISLINLTTIGDSEKRDDDSKIGKFSSGMAYSTALLLRDAVGLEVNIYGGENKIEEDEGRGFMYVKYTENINYSTINKSCDSTGKSKEIIVLDYEKYFHGNYDSVLTFSEGHAESETIETAFALQLGYNWENWMVLRELWSNMLDEGGYVLEQESYPEPETGTVITLTFNEHNTFYEVWQNRHLYINEKEPLFKVSDKVEILENPEGYLRIYKQNILVYEDKEKVSRFAFNVKLGEIDERRILSNVYDVEGSICSAIMYSQNEDFLRHIITSDFEVSDEEFLASRGSYASASDLIHKIAFEVQEEFGEVNSYYWLIDKIKERKDCKINGKTLSNIGDHLWSYSGKVTVDTTPAPYAEPAIVVEDVEYVCPFSAEIKKYYNFDLDVEVKKAKLRGSKVIADKYEKCLIIDEDFKVEEDFHLFLVQYLDLTKTGNIINNLSYYICDLIKK
jgi:hypothetical protein